MFQIYSPVSIVSSAPYLIRELMAALLRLPNLRRASGGDGRILYEGQFPDRLILKFDSGGATAGKG